MYIRGGDSTFQEPRSRAVVEQGVALQQNEGTHLYGVATMSRLFKITGLFCKRALQKRRYSAKEAHHLKEPTNRSPPIPET